MKGRFQDRGPNGVGVRSRAEEAFDLDAEHASTQEGVQIPW